MFESVTAAPAANYLDVRVAAASAVRLAVIICDIVHRADGKRLMSQSLALFVKLQELPADASKVIERKKNGEKRNANKIYGISGAGYFSFYIILKLNYQMRAHSTAIVIASFALTLCVCVHEKKKQEKSQKLT